MSEQSEYRKILLHESEIEVLSNLLQNGGIDLQRGLARSQAGESLMELTELSSEDDAEYIIELYQGVLKKLKSIQSSLKRNDVRFIAQENAYRSEETIHVYQIIGDVVNRLVYIHETRHGAFYFYADIDSLIRMYLDGKESDTRYESETAMEHFLYYWRG